MSTEREMADIRALMDDDSVTALLLDQERMTPREDDGHEHQWPADLDADAMCEAPGCHLRYGEWSEPT